MPNISIELVRAAIESLERHSARKLRRGTELKIKVKSLDGPDWDLAFPEYSNRAGSLMLMRISQDKQALEYQSLPIYIEGNTVKAGDAADALKLVLQKTGLGAGA